MTMNLAASEIFQKAIVALAEARNSTDPPILYDASNRPIKPTTSYQFSRAAAKMTGSLKNWFPRKLTPRGEAYERARIMERSVDLANSDPHAAGIIDTYATTIVGAGLVPQISLDPDLLEIDKKAARRIQAQQKAVYWSWYPFADAGQRMTYGGIQFLVQRNLVQYGEFLVLLHMIDDPGRPYSLACQVISPLRLKTPVDLVGRRDIRDGVEIGEYGEPVAYWIERANTKNPFGVSSGHSMDFVRIPSRRGHRWNVIHQFYQNDAEQIRGIPFFTPALKFFKDLNDYLDAELVANVVTAAFALFIEVPQETDPQKIARNLSVFTENRIKEDGSQEEIRYQEVDPGSVMYGQPGQKPHPISVTRPGTTFEPFVRVIKKAIAVALGIPYPVLFKDLDAVTFAGFRSAMLEAWRVFEFRRSWLGQVFNQNVYTMLMEEAYLRGDLDVDDFYSRMWALTKADWIGYPKGEIEPWKAAQADRLMIQTNLKTRSKSIAERGGEIRSVFDQLQEEQEMMRERSLTESRIEKSEDIPEDSNEERERQ